MPDRVLCVECVAAHALTPPCRAAEYRAVLYATAVGIVIMGFLGYIIKLVHYPVKEILLGAKQ